jgi:NAD(P)-dependent dehydrogenase (short-subunit alcohol dehydrogenase family)
MKQLKGKTAVLTGAASGFGLACAEIAADAGMNLVLLDVQADALAAVAERFEARGVPLLAQTVDVSDGEAMDRMGQAVAERFGAPHFVFNNAGVGASGLIWEASVADWEWVLGVNVWGVIHGVRVFTPMMLAAAKADPDYSGHIVNTASMAGLLTPPNMGVYNVSKHAVVALTETLYQDLRLVTEQVSTSVLCPYFVPTGISQSERNRPQHLASAGQTNSQLIGQTMMGKAVQSGRMSAQDVAEKVFAAIKTDQFYIYSHPHALGTAQERFEAITGQTQPPDPFASRPHIGEELRAALRDNAA